MKCAICGNDHFYGGKVCTCQVEIDANGEYASVPNNTPDITPNIVDTGETTGPFVCTLCGAQYETITDGVVPSYCLFAPVGGILVSVDFLMDYFLRKHPADLSELPRRNAYGLHEKVVAVLTGDELSALVAEAQAAPYACITPIPQLFRDVRIGSDEVSALAHLMEEWAETKAEPAEDTAKRMLMRILKDQSPALVRKALWPIPTPTR